MKLRTFLAVALLAPTVALAAQPKSKPKAPEPAAEPSAGSALSLGGFIGYETADVSGLSLRVDGEMPFQKLSPQVNLSFVGSLGYSYLTESSFGGGKFSANVFKLVPAARFTFPLNPQVSLFADGGLGLAFVSAKVEFPGIPGFIPSFSESHSTVNLMMRLGVGGWYHVNPKLRLGAMLELDPIFGDFGFSGASSQNTFIFQVGAMFDL